MAIHVKVDTGMSRLGVAPDELVALVTRAAALSLDVVGVMTHLANADVAQGMLKSIVFGLIVTLIGCYQGFNASGGGRGVGLGTTRAVGLSSVAILISDYFLSDILLRVMSSDTGVR